MSWQTVSQPSSLQMSDLREPGSDCSVAKQCLFPTMRSIIISKNVGVLVSGLKLIQTFKLQKQAETQPANWAHSR